ncbi:hypothetical protein [Pseudoneobacillus sp. C159]
MKNNKNDKPMKLSFESDGKMGGKTNPKENSIKPNEFFNTTQNSE